ncbi:NF038122 family metalloprotease [Paucibacter sediminis]|uniref:NF038122 family metalloprotease n=1 Tax=Paucibacter sediminis TaxID=3019553 RepID=A0AA95N841_9BURK|nr:NF038122 family metalloprotease [Paucibacter sp. S2-9]WIT10137.1 NF038122 family metalloprotease [Paucibacter sp. S2-9]
MPAVARPLRPLSRLARSIALSLACAAAGPAPALVINASFGAGVDPAAQSVILGTIDIYEALFSDNITLGIRFENMNTGLGQSSTNIYQVPYASFMDKLRADASSPIDSLALAHIPLGANPVNGAANIILTRATANAVGFNVPAPLNGLDATISLNLATMNFSRLSIDPDKYDLQTVASHEIDEVLGTISGVGGSLILPVDLYRYNAAGARSFTTLGDDAYFSIDGVNMLVRYNQNPAGDYGDYWGAGPHPVHVQDAFGTRGSFADLGVEIVALDAVGFTLAAAVPEPAPVVMLLAGLGMLGWLKRRQV